jgi:hypothetical protein
MQLEESDLLEHNYCKSMDAEMCRTCRFQETNENLTGRVHFGVLDVCWRVILKQIPKKFGFKL